VCCNSGKSPNKDSLWKTQQKIESSVTPLWTPQSCDANSFLKISEFCSFIQEHYCVFYIWSVFMLNRVAQKSKVPTDKIFSTKCQWLLHARKIVKLLICLKNNWRTQSLGNRGVHCRPQTCMKKLCYWRKRVQFRKCPFMYLVQALNRRIIDYFWHYVKEARQLPLFSVCPTNVLPWLR
jgi:hypothetical protein